MTARDPGAADAIFSLILILQNADIFMIRVAASPPASTILTMRGVSVIEMPHNGLESMTQAADKLLLEVSPEIVVSGLSGPDIGIDEIIRHRFAGPRAVVQDFWGDVNLGLGLDADMILVQDAYAATLTTQRLSETRPETSLPLILEIGPLKSAMLANVDWPKRRATFRSQLQVDESMALLVFCLQPLIETRDYIASIEAWAVAATSLGLAMIKPHPKNYDAGLDIAKKFGLCAVHDMEMGDTAAAADCLCSAYSSANIDAVLINRVSSVPMAVPVYLLPPEILKDFGGTNNGCRIPHITDGMALCIENLDEVLAGLTGALARRHEVWDRTQHLLPKTTDVGVSCQNAVLGLLAMAAT
jgi:hypothetical protein